MAHIYAGHYWNYEYALLFSFFRPEQDKLPTQAQVDTFTAEFKCLSDEEVQELVAALPSSEVMMRQAAMRPLLQPVIGQRSLAMEQ